MIEEFFKIAQQYGAAGIIIFALGAFIFYKEKQAEKERRDHKETFEKQHKEMVEMAERHHEETLEVAKNSTSVLTEISTLIKYRKK
jgi:hydroxymethylpyrimidine pyrophosphatase-like HAD family hydrolase